MIKIRIARFILFAGFLCACSGNAFSMDKPLRIGIAGLTHTHVHWIFNSAKTGNIEIVGIAEENRELAEQYALQYNFPTEKIYSSLYEMVTAEKPEAVAAFNSIAGHLKVIETCAPLGIHVMVEKPLAVSLDDATKIAALARRYKVHVMTNYETTWYGSVHKAFEMTRDSAFGEIRKIVVHDGHKGPKEIGVNKEFLEWLTDPEENGAGALMDFGCYGANLSTWIMKGEKPLSVTAVIQQIKPEVYPDVDDEATIILTYPSSQTIIQASWNWPFSRKDMELYGSKGYVIAKDRVNLAYRYNEADEDSLIKIEDRKSPFHDPFEFFRGVIRKEIQLPENDLSSLQLNLIVMEILEAAKRSAVEGKTIFLDE